MQQTIMKNDNDNNNNKNKSRSNDNNGRESIIQIKNMREAVKDGR